MTNEQIRKAEAGELDQLLERVRLLLKVATKKMPDGCAILPMKSTPTMEKAGAKTFGGKDNANARYEVSVMWHAMVAAYLTESRP